MTKAKGAIVTNSTGFVIYKNGRFYVQIDWTGGSNHVEAVKYLAKKHFGTGRLRKTESTELPCAAFERWGFTERTGEVSVKVTHYTVF